MMQHLINPVYYQDYILSGKPEFTLASTKNKVEEIFVVHKGRELWFVKNRTRDDLGHIRHLENDLYVFEKATKFLLEYEQKQVEQFTWFWTKFLAGTLPSHIEIRYAGRCGHCGRELTHPESLPIGIGPDCFVKLGLIHKTLIKAYVTGTNNSEDSP